MKVIKENSYNGKEYLYKNFILKRNGYPKTPWNIYNKNYDWVGFAETMKQAKYDIDAGCYEDFKEEKKG